MGDNKSIPEPSYWVPPSCSWESPKSCFIGGAAAIIITFSDIIEYLRVGVLTEDSDCQQIMYTIPQGETLSALLTSDTTYQSRIDKSKRALARSNAFFVNEC